MKALTKWCLATLCSVPFAIFAAPETPAVKSCPALPDNKCKAAAPEGKLVLKGGVWITACPPNPNSYGPEEDHVCRQIAQCSGAGGFAPFLQAVSDNCKRKSFEGYHGLDGLTFGILDWTQTNLGTVLQQFKQRNSDQYSKVFGGLNIPMKDGCVEQQWACDANRRGHLNCDPTFRAAFKQGLAEPDFKKAQIDIALTSYNQRTERVKALGFKSEYGNVAMAVLLNQFHCKPAELLAACSNKADEKSRVDCVLDEYIAHKCRSPKRDGSGERRRVKAIKEAFEHRPAADLTPVSGSAVEACITSWAQ